MPKPTKLSPAQKKMQDAATERLKIITTDTDMETAHINADGVLCGLLCDLGFEDVVAAWGEVDKWYA